MEAETKALSEPDAPRPRARWLLPLLTGLAAALAVVIIAFLASLGPFSDGAEPQTASAEPRQTAESVSEVKGALRENEEAFALPEGETFALPPVQAATAIPARPELFGSSGMRIVIPKLGVNRGTVTMGIGSDGATFQTPHNAYDVAWYNFSGAPGSPQSNPIFAGHINFNGASGTFRWLSSLAPGDLVDIHQVRWHHSRLPRGLGPQHLQAVSELGRCRVSARRRLHFTEHSHAHHLRWRLRLFQRPLRRQHSRARGVRRD